MTTTFEILQALLSRGPSRVLAADGTAAAPTTGLAGLDVVFVRGDGWSLGAPSSLAEEARKLWADAWVIQIERDGTEWWFSFCAAAVDNAESDADEATA
jgi:hypothetical protein